MKHYIDKSALVAEIERLSDADLSYLNNEQKSIYLNVIGLVKTTINSLEVKEIDTEQLAKLLNWWKDVTTEHSVYKVKEVDIEKELEKEWSKFLENGDIGYKEVAKHFFELGLKASSNISIEVTSIDEELKENGIDPNSKEAKIIKESYYTAIERLSTQKGE